MRANWRIIGGACIGLGLAAAPAHAQIATPPRPVMNVVPGETVPLSIVVNGGGGVRTGAELCKPVGGKTSAMCQRTLVKGKPVTIEARPDPGQSFAGWAGACQGQGLRCQITPTAAVSIAATFQPAVAAQTVTIRVQIPDPAGSVRPGPFASVPINCKHTVSGYVGGTCLVTIPRGTGVDLVATPDSGASFVRWESDQAGCNGPKCAFNADNPAIVTARFALAEAPKVALTVTYPVSPASAYSLTLSPDAKFTCQSLTKTMMSCVAMVPVGQPVALQATRDVGVALTTQTPVSGPKWAGACAGTIGKICTIQMSGPKQVEIKAN